MVVRASIFYRDLHESSKWRTTKAAWIRERSSSLGQCRGSCGESVPPVVFTRSWRASCAPEMCVMVEGWCGVGEEMEISG